MKTRNVPIGVCSADTELLAERTHLPAGIVPAGGLL